MQIFCRVKPKSKVNSIHRNKEGILIIKIMAIPLNGQANQYLIKYLSEVFDVPKKNIDIISGHINSHKRINIVGDITKRLEQLPIK